MEDCQQLRFELKTWEKSFAAANGGRKAGREDIKQHPEIANKYKLYNTLRAGGTTAPQKPDAPPQDRSPKKRQVRKPPASTETPRKRQKHLSTSQNEGTTIEQLEDHSENTPVTHRISIGPTPQKNGRVLGLFDLLTPSSTVRTPSKRQSLASLPLNVAGTPSRNALENKATTEEKPLSPVKRDNRSPPSSSKRTYLASFLTPSACRIGDVGGTPEGISSMPKLRFDDTPAFLRRDSQRFSQNHNTAEPINGDDEDASSWSPIAVRIMRPKPVGRGLSALVKGLRELEEARLDDDLEMLREVEGKATTAIGTQPGFTPRVCVADSQVPEMPLGPDGQAECDAEELEESEAEGKDRHGKRLKVWKKKGQKRTTRQIAIKPNTSKWKPELEWKGGKEAESEEDTVGIEETQLVTIPDTAKAYNTTEAIQTDEEYISEDVSDCGEAHVLKPAKVIKQKGQSGGAQHKLPKEKKPKKISATAHANFRALKIRNKNSKAKGRGRFGRRH
ncbi:MAG: hypothetical protein Q9219_000999 [cf. Caloplaca sp. 3 TL-2023]